jgi:hypothetical protein
VKTSTTVGLLVGAFLAVTALGADAPKANLQITMLTKVNPQATALWNLTNDAQDDNGNIDPKKIKPEIWAKLLEAGKSIEEGGRTLATSNGIIAAPPGSKLQDESGPGASKAADVQRYLDAKPAEFKKHATELQNTGSGIVAAVTKKDGKKLTDLSNALDEVCENCHVIFWYPQQNAPKKP